MTTMTQKIETVLANANGRRRTRTVPATEVMADIETSDPDRQDLHQLRCRERGEILQVCRHHHGSPDRPPR